MKRGTPEHPKVYDLAERLKIRRPYVLGYLELMFHFTATYAPDGAIGRFPDARIEAALDWIGPKGRLIQALVESKWLDSDPVHRLVVHDWSDHADLATKKRLERAGQCFAIVAGKVTIPLTIKKMVSDLPRARALPEPEPEPEPEPCRTNGERDGQSSFDGQVGFRALLAAYPEHRRDNSRIAAGHYLDQVTEFGREVGRAAEHHVAILASLERWVASADWRKERGRYVPRLNRWLTEGQWRNAPELPEAPPIDDPEPEHVAWYRDAKKNGGKS